MAGIGSEMTTLVAAVVPVSVTVSVGQGLARAR